MFYRIGHAYFWWVSSVSFLSAGISVILDFSKGYTVPSLFAPKSSRHNEQAIHSLPLVSSCSADCWTTGELCLVRILPHDICAFFFFKKMNQPSHFPASAFSCIFFSQNSSFNSNYIRPRSVLEDERKCWTILLVYCNLFYNLKMSPKNTLFKHVLS